MLLSDSQAPTPPTKLDKKLQSAVSLQNDLEILLKELDEERKHADALRAALEAAQADGQRALDALFLSAGNIEIPEFKPGDDLIRFAAEAVKQRMNTLKASRDKLIAALDAQSVEVDRVQSEHTALLDALIEANTIAEQWQAQVQASLSQNERLKELLEESAHWGSSMRLNSEETTEGEVTVQVLESQLLTEKARNAELELAARALCAELTRMSQRVMQLERAIGPVVGGVESRLRQLLNLQPRRPIA